MMPIKEMLSIKPYGCKEPPLVIDEAGIRSCWDAGPVCECCERFKAVQEFKPFMPGGLSPYVEKKFISDRDCLRPFWIRNQISLDNQNFDKVMARHEKDIPATWTEPKLQDEFLIDMPPYESEPTHADSIGPGCYCPPAAS